MEEQQNLPVRWSRKTKRGALMLMIRDLQRFNEDQLKTLIAMAHKVRHAKRYLAQVAEEAQAMMDEIQPNQFTKRHADENEGFEGKKGSEPKTPEVEHIYQGSLTDAN